LKFNHLVIVGDTRYRDGQEPSCLDLLLTDNLTDIENLNIVGGLGASDHVGIVFDIPVGLKNVMKIHPDQISTKVTMIK